MSVDGTNGMEFFPGPDGHGDADLGAGLDNLSPHQRNLVRGLRDLHDTSAMLTGQGDALVPASEEAPSQNPMIITCLSVGCNQPSVVTESGGTYTAKCLSGEVGHEHTVVPSVLDFLLEQQTNTDPDSV